MKKETIGIIPCLFVLLVSFPAWAAQKTEVLSITPNNQEGKIEVFGGTWEKINSKDVLKITLNEEAPLHPLFTIKDPGISGKAYVIEGKIKSEALTGQGYLEMLSTFPNGQTYFSRTLSKKGPQAALSGSFDWRPFSLPFIRSKNSPVPNLISFNLKAPKRTVLYLSELKLLQGATLDEGWLSREELGLIGGILGGVLGCLGGLIGLLSAKGKAQNLVKLIIALCIILALGLLVSGLLAALYSQPEYMYTSLLISGAFLILLFVFVQRSVSKCYQEIELRRIKAQDTL